MKYYVIDGANFHDAKTYYDEVNRVLCPDFKEFGHNLDAFNDILSGGFGKYEYGEEISLTWLNSDKSKSDLLELFQTLVEIINDHKNITLILK